MKANTFVRIFAVALVCILTLGACKKDKAEIADKNIEKAVSQLTLPQELKDGITLTNCSYKDKELTYRLELPKDKLDKLDVDQSRAKTLENLKGGLLPQNLVNNIVAANASIQYIMVCDKDSVAYKFTSQELQ